MLPLNRHLKRGKNNRIIRAVNYLKEGEPDTLLCQDTVFGSDYNDYLFNVIQNDDGSLIAYKRNMVTQ